MAYVLFKGEMTPIEVLEKRIADVNDSLKREDVYGKPVVELKPEAKLKSAILGKKTMPKS